MTRPTVVLVVDDDARVRSALAGLLEATGGMSAVTAGPDQARSLTWPLRGIGVAVVDVPDGSTRSVDLVSRLARRVPVVAVSMHASLHLPAIQAGAAAFVEKSGDAAAILDAIALALAGPREEPTE